MNTMAKLTDECQESIQGAALAVAKGDYMDAICHLTTAIRRAAILHSTRNYVDGMQIGRISPNREVGK